MYANGVEGNTLSETNLPHLPQIQIHLLPVPFGPTLERKLQRGLKILLEVLQGPVILARAVPGHPRDLEVQVALPLHHGILLGQGLDLHHPLGVDLRDQWGVAERVLGRGKEERLPLLGVVAKELVVVPRIQTDNKINPEVVNPCVERQMQVQMEDGPACLYPVEEVLIQVVRPRLRPLNNEEELCPHIQCMDQSPCLTNLPLWLPEKANQ